VAALKAAADTGNLVMDQIAFAELLNSGGYDLHLRHMRRRYLKRRNVLMSALAQYLPDATVLGAAAGVQLTVHFPAGYDMEALIERAETKRVKVEPLTPCYTDPRDAPAGLMLGYANLGEAQLSVGVQALGDAAAYRTPRAGKV
jgi:GntR family transcriptional regulator / MocR family aminotransferase